MSELPPQDPNSQRPDPQKPGGKPRMTLLRIAVWVVVGGLGLYLLITGIVGVISKS